MACFARCALTSGFQDSVAVSFVHGVVEAQMHLHKEAAALSGAGKFDELN
jgi:hypothetical protein